MASPPGRARRTQPGRVGCKMTRPVRYVPLGTLRTLTCVPCSLQLRGFRFRETTPDTIGSSGWRVESMARCSRRVGSKINSARLKHVLLLSLFSLADMTPRAAWLEAGCSTVRQARPPSCAAAASFAAVRCCSTTQESTTTCVSICNALDANRNQHAYEMPRLHIDGTLANLTEAQAECESLAGRRLCSRAELQGGICCKTGCGMDGSLVWAADPCPGPGRLRPSKRRPRRPTATDYATARSKKATCQIKTKAGPRLIHEERPDSKGQPRLYPQHPFSGTQHRNLSSPDPLCGVHLSNLQGRAAWLLKLPVFLHMAQLHPASPWGRYLRAVYGELSESDFPLDVRCFIFFYADELPRGVMQSLFEPNMYSVVRQQKGDYSRLKQGHILDFTGAAGCAWLVYLHDEASIDPQLHQVKKPLLVNPSAGQISRLMAGSTGRGRYLTGAFASKARVEIYHQYDDCAAGGAAGKEIGYWAHYAPGSGVFADLGTTVVTGSGGYGDAVRHLANADSNSKTSPHDLLYRTARERGYDSVQSCCGKRGKTYNFYEMSFYGSSCKGSDDDPRVGGCPTFLSAGRSNPRRCNCRNGSLPTTRCSV